MQVKELKEFLKDIDDESIVYAMGYDDEHDGEITYSPITELGHLLGRVIIIANTQCLDVL